MVIIHPTTTAQNPPQSYILAKNILKHALNPYRPVRELLNFYDQKKIRESTEQRWYVKLRSEDHYYLFLDPVAFPVDRFYEEYGMKRESVQRILEIIGPEITGQPTNAKKPVEPLCRLLAFLHFLRHGHSLRQTANTFALGPQSIS